MVRTPGAETGETVPIAVRTAVVPLSSVMMAR
jgi:hypothetical protein